MEENTKTVTEAEEKESVSKNFIEREIEKDLAEGVYNHVQTRFPPEPNGYLHIGHAKSIILNSDWQRNTMANLICASMTRTRRRRRQNLSSPLLRM